MIGRRLQRYLLEEEVGHGGMAAVYRGRDTSLDREVAIKVLYPHLAARPEHRLRLAREARAVARLAHPAIVEIYDFSGEDAEDAYIVTELIRGRTLRAFATEHPFDPPELAAVCVHELAGALEHAHGQGIVHRDIKPENVMVREEGGAAVKLMDFGIAQILDRDDRMTVTGALMGSPAHMAPEIIAGEEADERSDIFSLGTILYWLATGELPFEAPNPGALLKRILEGEYQDPRELAPAVSDDLAAIIIDCLAPREQRIQTASELKQRLKKLLDESGVERPDEVLAAFIESPKKAAKQFKQELIAHLMRSGHQAISENRPARALALFARIIAMAPGTVDAGAARDAIEGLKIRTRRRRLAWQIGSALVLAVAVTLSGFWMLPKLGAHLKDSGGLKAAFLSTFRLEGPSDSEQVTAQKQDSASGRNPDPIQQENSETPSAEDPERSGDETQLPDGTPSPNIPLASDKADGPSPSSRGSVTASAQSSRSTLPSSQGTGPSAHGASQLDSPHSPAQAALGNPGSPSGTRQRPGASTQEERGQPQDSTAELGQTGRVFITVKPFAHIWLNGETLGTTPWEGEAPVGEQRFVLTHECCQPLEIEAEVRRDRRLELREKLIPNPARIQLDLDGPPDTGIMLDDAFWAYASEAMNAPLLVPMAQDARGEPRYDREVSLRLFRAGYRDHIVPVTVRAGQLTTVKVRLEPQG